MGRFYISFCGKRKNSMKMTGKAKKNYYSIDITGKTFGRLAALYPTAKRSKGGTVIWHCRCSCGTEVDVSYNDLVYTNLKSCGCQKKEHDAALHGYLTHAGGTSIDMVRSRKIHGKYIVKIVFQKKQHQTVWVRTGGCCVFLS